ncbi:hypothetical protein FIU09_01790 [Stenotrophomonas maltophilia]|nr:hypothetical protein FIU09_01790 [Stenotrophomonas maltophilia]TPD81629.1 hypothetical protein FJN21_00585 [Stenotrophomonas maltophilia]TPD83134.1 hypothetical protein FJN20_09390 [Stenotrophomonas maltophilia]TPD86626.1 hypothetical protein FJN19_03230 [Stenotrophomonas maltophilia]
MNTETREERIKRLMKEREEGTLTEKPAPFRAEEKRVEPESELDWEEESRIISAKNRERIKKNADVAAAQAKAATQFAEKGAKTAIKSLLGFKSKVEVKLQEEKAKRRLKREEQKETRSADVALPTSDSSSELPTQRGRVQRQTRMKFWLLCSIPIALSIVLVGAWLFKTRDTVEVTKASSTDQPKTERAAEPTQVLAPIQAVLPIVEEPPQALPPLPQETQAEHLELEVPAAIAEKRPEAKRPIVTSERAAEEKAVEKSAEPKKSQWQKDAAQKLKDYQF